MEEILVNDFSLKDTLECGQTFCWVKDGQGYINTDMGQVVYVEQEGDTLYYASSERTADVKSLLGLADPIDEMKDSVSIDGLMKKCIEYSPGLRIVRDPFFPCLIAFLCSPQSNIPRIRGNMMDFRTKFGESHEFRGNEYYRFPTPEKIASLTDDDLQDLNLGWRAKYVLRSSRGVVSKRMNYRHLRNLGYERAHQELQTLHGVGPKVADCVCLFSLGFLEAFPIDIWITRVIKTHYSMFDSAGKSYSRRARAARNYFGTYAGYAQQLLYHYFRSREKSEC